MVRRVADEQAQAARGEDVPVKLTVGGENEQVVRLVACLLTLFRQPSYSSHSSTRLAGTERG